MNVLAVIILALGIVFIVAGFKGHGDNIIAIATGKSYGKSTLK